VNALLLSLLLFVPGPTPPATKCPPYWVFAGWDREKDVHVDLTGLGIYKTAAMKALNEWNAANTFDNGSNIVFDTDIGPGLTDLVIVMGRIPDTARGRAAGITVATGIPGRRIIFATITVDVDKFGQFNREQFFQKIVMHEVGHTMGLGDVPTAFCGDSAGGSIMNQLCQISNNDSDGMLPMQPTPCDNNTIKNDPRQQPPIAPKPPLIRNPDPSCAPGGGGPLVCREFNACTSVFLGPEFCTPFMLCEGGGGGPYVRFSCSGTRSQVTINGPVCGDWRLIPNSEGLPGDYACQDIFNPPTFQAPTCEQIGLHSDEGVCNACAQSCAHTTIADVGMSCWSCPGTNPGPVPDPGGCIAQTSCGYSTGEGCSWVPDGCGGTHLCGTCGKSCLPGYNEAGEPIIDCGGSGGGNGNPSCDGAHNEVCYPSFKSCQEECCGVCERRIGCGGEAAHKCFEP